MNKTITPNLSIEERRDRRQKAIDSLVREVSLVRVTSPSVGLQWAGTTTDLLEAVHIAYLSGRLKDPGGRPETFISLAEQVFAVLHKRLPVNPSSYISKSGQRKNMRQKPYIERYEYQLTRLNISHPFTQMTG